MRSSAERLPRAGALGFLEKPVDPDALLTAVSIALDAEAAQRHVANEAEDLL